MTSAIEIDDIKKIIGGLIIENHILQSRLEDLRLELEEIKMRIADKDNPHKQGGKKEKQLGIIDNGLPENK